MLAACAAIAAQLASCGTLRAARLLEDALEAPPEIAAEVEESTFSVDVGGESVAVDLYRPRASRGPLPAIVLVHGAAEAGARDARLVGFARALAVRGATVAAPELEALAGFRLDPADPERLAGVVQWLAGEAALAEDGRVSLFGVSVGGSYALVAATRPQARGRLRTVLAVGAYADLGTLLHEWMTAQEKGPAELLDARAEGRQRLLLANAGALVPREDLEAVELRIAALLAGEAPADAPPDLGERARALLEAAASREPFAAEEARRLLAPLAETLAALSPLQVDAAPAARVHLLHGEEDPVVPPSHLAQLAAHLEARGARPRVLRTELLGHVGRESELGLRDAWPLLRFVARTLGAAGL